MGFRVGEAFPTKGAPKATAQSAAGSSSVIDLTGDDDSPAPKTKAPKTKAQKRPASHPPGTFAPGTELVLHGLERCPDLNGAKVRVQSFDEQSKRYVIDVLQLSSGAKPSEADATKAIKSANLRPARQGTSAPVVIDLDDGDSAPPAKRQRGDKEAAPGKARQNKPATSATPPASSPAPMPTAAAVPPPSLAVGAEVTVRGLESRPDLNGATARVQRWDAQSGRYALEILRLASGATPAVSDTSKALQPKNLERWPPPRPPRPPPQPPQPPQQQVEKEKENETGKRETVRKQAQQQQAAARGEQERLQRERQQAAAAERKQRLQREKAERDEVRARERARAREWEREREAAAELQRRRELQEAMS